MVVTWWTVAFLPSVNPPSSSNEFTHAVSWQQQLTLITIKDEEANTRQ